jgi:hypothetical protein
MKADWHSRASDDIDNSDKIRTVLKDLREARQSKSREGLRSLDHNEMKVGSLLLGLGRFFDWYRIDPKYFFI